MALTTTCSLKATTSSSKPDYSIKAFYVYRHGLFEFDSLADVWATSSLQIEFQRPEAFRLFPRTAGGVQIIACFRCSSTARLFDGSGEELAE